MQRFLCRLLNIFAFLVPLGELIPQMPHIFLLLPLLVGAECHFSQLRKAAIINLHLLDVFFSSHDCDILLFFCPVGAQTDHMSDILPLMSVHVRPP